MSAEGKKKRGESGRKHARSIPFRYGKSVCDFSVRIGKPQRFGGSQFLNAMRLGAVLGGPGYNPTHRAYNALDDFMEKCPVAGRL